MAIQITARTAIRSKSQTGPDASVADEARLAADLLAACVAAGLGAADGFDLRDFAMAGESKVRASLRGKSLLRN